ncbi:MAG: crossover junction endodeoxyribonuclease RuvC [Verrucomicrobiota bacterium]
MRILGIDPSLRCTGYGIIEIRQSAPPRTITFGSIKNQNKLTHAKCFFIITRTLQDLIEEFNPDEASIENIIYVQNSKTAIGLGGARAAALIALEQAGLPIFEYPAKIIKKGATGTGNAAKNQVGFMMRSILGLDQTPTPDEGDALAAALTHSQNLHRRTH